MDVTGDAALDSTRPEEAFQCRLWLHHCLHHGAPHKLALSSLLCTHAHTVHALTGQLTLNCLWLLF